MASEVIRQVRSATSIKETAVQNAAGEDQGEIKDLMIDLNGGRIVYAVFSGAFLAYLGDKLFAIPWGALSLSQDKNGGIHPTRAAGAP